MKGDLFERVANDCRFRFRFDGNSEDCCRKLVALVRQTGVVLAAENKQCADAGDGESEVFAMGGSE